MQTHILFHSSERLSCRWTPGDCRALGINVRKTDYIHCSYCICRLCTSQDRRSMPWCTLYPFILTVAKPFINQWAPGFPPTKRVAFLWGSEPPLFHRYPHCGKFINLPWRAKGAQNQNSSTFFSSSWWAHFITLSNTFKATSFVSFFPQTVFVFHGGLNNSRVLQQRSQQKGLRCVK